MDGGGGTVAEHLARNPKTEGSNLAAFTGREVKGNFTYMNFQLQVVNLLL
jgi:hypothetical protein